MNRADFQRLANLRVKEAKVLLDNGCYEGAYYLAGYAVECALKACIAKQTREYDFPPDAETVRNSIYTHDLTRLLRQAGLAGTLDTKSQSDAVFRNNWGVLRDWSEQSRYNSSVTQLDAETLYSAIVGRNGALTWLKTYW